MGEILDRLRSCENRVVDITLSPDKKSVELMEACDDWFYVNLNKQEFGQMIQELQELHDQMVDVDKPTEQ